MPSKKNSGYTLVELSVAMTLLLIAVTLALTGYMFSFRNTHIGDIQNGLDIDVQKAMERLKHDLRMSSLDHIHFHPEGATECQALSFPVAYDSDGDGVLEKNADGDIIWDETIIYHIRDGDPDKLTRTSFKNREELDGGQRQAQLEHVVDTGYGTGTYNGDNASSYVLFENLLNWKIIPTSSKFDGYAPFPTSTKANLGYALLGPGMHTIQFDVYGKNSASSGYTLGIDQVFASQSQSAREGETQTVVTEVPVTAQQAYLESGVEGNHHLFFPAAGPGASLAVQIENDLWTETNYKRGQPLNTTVEFDQSLAPKDFVVRLEGNDTSWKSSEQTGSLDGYSITNIPYYASGNLPTGSTYRVHLNGSELFDNPDWFVFNGQKCKLNFRPSFGDRLRVENVRIGKTLTPNLKNFGFDPLSPPQQVTFTYSNNTYLVSPVPTNNQIVTTDWIDLEINTTNNYLLEYSVVNNPAFAFPMVWTNTRSTAAETLLLGGTTNFFNQIFGLASVDVSYAPKGTYTSQIFDTQHEAPAFDTLDCSADVPSGTSLKFKVRTGDDLDDFPMNPSSWDGVSSQSAPLPVTPAYRRYVQFQALLTSDLATGLKTPKVKDVTIKWPSEERMVGIWCLFTKGPDRGKVEVSVDGNPLRSALTVDLEIYDDPTGMKNTRRRVTSSLRAEISPRNTGL